MFDGCSNYIGYEPEELLVQGEALAVSVWVAPRAFEWDDPNAAANGTEHLTAIAEQYSKEKSRGSSWAISGMGGCAFRRGPERSG